MYNNFEINRTFYIAFVNELYRRYNKEIQKEEYITSSVCRRRLVLSRRCSDEELKPPPTPDCEYEL